MRPPRLPLAGIALLLLVPPAAVAAAYLAEFRRHPGWSRLLVKYFGDDAPLVLGLHQVN